CVDYPVSRRTGVLQARALLRKRHRTTPRAKLLWRAHPWLFDRDAVSLCGNGPSRRASAADAAGAHWTLVGCAIGIFFGQDSSPAPFCSAARERDNAGAKIDVADPRSRGGFGQQAGLGHS